MKAVFILLLSVVIGFATSAQPAEVDYALIDHASEQVKYNGSVSQLSHDLTRQYTTEMEKARAIFAWVTHHVAYDIDFINEGRKTQFPKCRKKDDCRALFAKWELDYVEETAKSGKSICHGYALLFKTLCAHAGIQCSVVSGYTKQESGLVGRMGRLNHAWNIMLINGEYYNVDAT